MLLHCVVTLCVLKATAKRSTELQHRLHNGSNMTWQRATTSAEAEGMRIVWSAVRLLPPRSGQRVAMEYAIEGAEVPVNDFTSLQWCRHKGGKAVFLAKVCHCCCARCPALALQIACVASACSRQLWLSPTSATFGALRILCFCLKSSDGHGAARCRCCA